MLNNPIRMKLHSEKTDKSRQPKLSHQIYCWPHEEIIGRKLPNGHKVNTEQTDCAYHGVQRRMISVLIFFRIFEIFIFCFVVAICDLVHTVELCVAFLKC